MEGAFRVLPESAFEALLFPITTIFTTMSELDRLARVIRSWTGSKRLRSSVYEHDDPVMILTELGTQISPETLAYLTAETMRKEEVLNQLHAAEEELKKEIIKENTFIDPELDPRFYEETDRAVITIQHKKKEIIIADLPLPYDENRGGSTAPENTAADANVIDVEIED